jgi:pimeloyl-ACP methyl ester carboxylesterase
MLIDIVLLCLAIPILILFGIVLFGNLAVFNFLVFEYYLGTLTNPTEYPPVKVSQYIKNFWRELFYVSSKFLYLPVKWLDISVSGNKQATTAILLVHGYCRQQSDWLYLRKQFKDTGCPVFTVNLTPSFASIAKIAEDSLPKKIAMIKKRTGCYNIILIGHSMGGLVSSYYSEYLDTENLIQGVMTIGSPLHGTKVCVAAAGENGSQMCPNTDFVLDLCARIRQAPHKYYHVLSRMDNMIFPWRSAALDSTPASQQMILSKASHLEMLHRKDVAIQLNAWVKGIVA